MANTQTAPLRWTLDGSIVHLLHRASQAAEDQFARSVTAADITPRQLAVLAAVAENPNLNQTDLVRLTGVDRSTMADIVRRLVRNGFLSRSRTREDARAYAIRLTPKSVELATKLGESAMAAERALLASLPAPDRERLFELLMALVEGARDVAKPAAGARTHEATRAVRP